MCGRGRGQSAKSILRWPKKAAAQLSNHDAMFWHTVHGHSVNFTKRN
jgi:hypothetical protein